MRPMTNRVRGDRLRVDLLQRVRPPLGVFRAASIQSYTLHVGPLRVEVSDLELRRAQVLPHGPSATEFGLRAFDRGTLPTLCRSWILNRIQSISGSSMTRNS